MSSIIFPPRLIKYNLRTHSHFLINSVNNTKYGLNPIKFFASKIDECFQWKQKIEESGRF